MPPRKSPRRPSRRKHGEVRTHGAVSHVPASQAPAGLLPPREGVPEARGGGISQGGVAVIVDIDPQFALQSIETDKPKLLQILLNLLSNAVKFTEAGGTVTLSAKWVAEWLEIAVRDTGIGIAEEDLEKVMTPFGQVTSAYNAKEGFGLGLPLTNKLAQALGGKLRIESVLGQGTTVTIHLPRTSHFSSTA